MPANHSVGWWEEASSMIEDATRRAPVRPDLRPGPPTYKLHCSTRNTLSYMVEPFLCTCGQYSVCYVLHSSADAAPTPCTESEYEIASISLAPSTVSCGLLRRLQRYIFHVSTISTGRARARTVFRCAEGAPPGRKPRSANFFENGNNLSCALLIT